MIGATTDERRLRELGEEGVLALICDSTNVLREGESPSEADVARNLAALVGKAKGRVVVTTFASNVARLRAAAEAGFANGRQVIVMGRAMERVVAVARECGYFDGVPPLLGPDPFDRLARDKVLALATGSQGEPRAALARIAEDEHPSASLASGDRRRLLLAHHSRQREGGRQDHQRAGQARRRGGHRPHPAGARLRPSAPRRGRPDVRLAQAEDRGSRARRAAALERARRLRQGAGRPSGGARVRRRRRAPRRRRREGGRARRSRPALQGRRHPVAEGRRLRRPAPQAFLRRRGLDRASPSPPRARWRAIPTC